VPITADFSVEYEEFSETNLTEDGDGLVTFSGTRALVTDNDNESVQNAINMITDGVYSEAEGIYKRISSELQAEYELTGVLPEEPYAVTVSYEDSDNGRLYTVIISYEYTIDGEGNTDGYTYSATFDMLTGQYININTIAIEPAALNEAFALKLSSDLNALPDTEDGPVFDKKVKPEEVSNLFICAQQSGRGIAAAVIYGEVRGEVYHTTIDLNDYAGYLNRYGALVFGVE
jgi:hypothetical protein